MKLLDNLEKHLELAGVLRYSFGGVRDLFFEGNEDYIGPNTEEYCCGNFLTYTPVATTCVGVSYAGHIASRSSRLVCRYPPETFGNGFSPSFLVFRVHSDEYYFEKWTFSVKP